MADPTIFLKPSTMVIPLQFSDSGQIDFRFSRRDTGVYHTLWCYVVDENGGHIQDEQQHDIRILLANEDNINWDVPSSFPNYRFSLPETAAELFDFSTPANCYVNFALFTYSSNTYSGSSIIGTKWFSNYGNTSIEAPYSGTIKVQPSTKMYPQIRLIITDETQAYKNTGGKYFYLDNDASQTDLSSNGNIKVEIKYYSGHEPEPGAVSQDFCQINGQQAPAVLTNNGLNYNRNTTISGASIISTESKTNFHISVTDGRGLNSEYTTSITWANDIPATKFNDLKELSEDDLRYDYRLGTPIPTSLYLAPDWTATQYTTASVPDDWEYFADIGDNGTGLINQRDILNDQKRQLNLQLFRKYYRYIQEGTWLDDSYIDDNLYYLDANKILNQSSYPKATYTIDVVDINGIEKYAAYEFTLGQRTYVEDPDMFGYVYNTVAGGEIKTPFRKEVIISERSRNLDDPSKSTIKVQTYKNQWEDIFSSLTATTQSLQYASGGYARAANAVNPNGSINVHSLEQTFQQGDFALSGSATQSITWDGSYGIEITDLSNNLVKLRIASNGLAITTDGGATWNNAITGNGINTNYLLAGQIDASKINILSAAGDYAFSWNENGLNAVLPNYMDEESEPAYGEAYVRFNNLGIYGTKRGAEIEAALALLPASATEDDKIAAIKEYTTFFLSWDGLDLRQIDGNVVSLNPDVGLEIFNNENNTPWKWTQEKINGTNFNVDTDGNTYGINDLIPVLTLGEFHYIDDQSQDVKVYGLLVRNQNGVPTLYTDEDGDLTMIGDITANSITVNDGFLKRIYLENATRVSYLGTGKTTGITDSDVLISLGKTGTSPGNFVVKATGEYYGELAALSHVSGWEAQGATYPVGSEPSYDKYAILLGPHTENSTNYIMSVFDPSLARGTRVFDIDNQGNVHIGGTARIDGTTTLGGNLTLTGLMKIFGNPASSTQYLYLDGTSGEIGQINTSTNPAVKGWHIDVDGQAYFNQAHVTGEVNATSGNFSGSVTVGNNGQTGDQYIIIDGEHDQIKSSNYTSGSQGWAILADGSAEFNNVVARGEINAGSGNFYGTVTVGEDSTQPSKPYILIDGSNALIRSSNYQDGAGYGWMINSDGDAVFNNITARGAIKTAVFEYAEIQAVGGIFIFRPSSTIRAAERVGSTDDVQITVEKAHLFSVNDWCKVSNYTNSQSEPNPTSVLNGNGLTHVYKIKSVDPNNSCILVLENAYAALTSGSYKVIDSLDDLIGGALIDMGDENGNNNYGIGVNSSDNTVNLPARAISLFETAIDSNSNPKVSYNYRGILGTLPQLPTSQVNNNIYNVNMAGTQGIYTDNMYIGDASRFVAFYTENNQKKLRIKANEIVFEGVNGTDVNANDSMIEVVITSSNGTVFKNNQGSTILTCTVLQGNNDITSSVSVFAWKKNGSAVGTNSSNLTVNASDVSSTAVYTCDVTLS